MSDNLLKFFNHMLLSINDKLSECCCTTANMFWEATPCDMFLTYRDTTCAEWDQCQYRNRLYISPLGICDGTQNLVCECQNFRIFDWTDIIPGAQLNAVSIQYVGIGASSGIWTNDSLTLQSPTASTGISLSGKTLNDLEVLIDPLSDWNSTINIDGTYPASIIEPKTNTYDSPLSKTWDTKVSSISFRWNGSITDFIPFNSNRNAFAVLVASGLNAIISSGVTVSLNTPRSDLIPSTEDALFEIEFGQCGVEQPDIQVEKNHLQWGSIPTSGILFEYGNYDGTDFYLNSSVYFEKGTSTACRYEQITNNGPAFFDSEIQCCPQRGAKLGPNQDIGFSTTGYCKEGCGGYTIPWVNMERTVVIDGDCYRLSPHFFTFGKAGRLEYDYHNKQDLFIQPECDFPGDCEHSIPGDCAVQLFIPQFHKNAPWGPFGSYYSNIEDDFHKAYEVPYLSSYLNGAYGPAGSFTSTAWKYRPQGYIKTKGKWTETDTVEIFVSLLKPMPFWVGTLANSDKCSRCISSGGLFADFDYFVELTNIPATFSVSGNTGCSSGVILTYAATGRTIGQFISDINSITIKDYSSSTCPVFNFCLASDDASGISLTKVNNQSSELFENWLYTYGGGSENSLASNGPLADTRKYSGSEILTGPKRYQDIFIYNPENESGSDSGGDVNTYNDDVSAAFYSVPNVAALPPVCRFRTRSMPKDGSATTNIEVGGTSPIDNLKYRRNMWWLAIPGAEIPVILVQKSSTITDPLTSLTISVGTSGFITVVGSGNGFVTSGILNTNKNGAEYKATSGVVDLNNITFTAQGGGTYNPIIATTGLQYNIWLDDNTWWIASSGQPVANSGVAGASATPTNWSYKEPLLVMSGFELLTGAVAELNSWVRRRCIRPSGGGYIENLLPYCVPPNSTTLDGEQTLDCHSDVTLIGDRWLTYGCGSWYCKDEWYFKAYRCGCDEVWRCSTGPDGLGSFVPHPYNFEGNETNNGGYHGYSDANGTFAVNQPTLYICEYNFHPACTHPMLIKVPYQFIQTSGGQTLVSYEDGTNGTFLADEFCGDEDGWCQYVDISAPKFKESDIPREYPPRAYIAQRTSSLFCSINTFNYDIINVLCSGIPDAADCEEWDRIEGVTPVNTSGVDDLNTLRALFRPAVEPLTENDICGNGGCDRYDVNCGTKCCECNFFCEVVGIDACQSKGPYQCPCRQTVSFDDVYTETEIPFQCACELKNFNFQCAAGCQHPNGKTNSGKYWAGTYGYNETWDLTQTLEYCCGCESVNGQITFDYTINTNSCPDPGPDCTGDVIACHYNPCLSPLPAPFCSDPSDVGYSCQDTFPLPFTTNICCGATCSGVSQDDCVGEDCGDGVKDVYNITDFTTNHCASNNLNVCGFGTYSWNYQSSILGAGTSTLTHCSSSRRFESINIINFTNLISRVGTKVIPDYTCTNCPDLSPVGVSWNTIRNWGKGESWVCGYSNVGVATGLSDPRITGNICGCSTTGC